MYSQPITKKEAAMMIVGCYTGIDPVKKEKFSDRLCSELHDVKFLKEFNQIMTVRLIIFAPGLYQICYEH
jgi:hypothetical protein